MGYFNPIVSRLVKCLTCLAPHVGGDGEGGPDGGVEGKEDHPENHASPHCQVRELGKERKKKRCKESEREETEMRDGVRSATWTRGSSEYAHPFPSLPCPSSL